MKIYVAGGMREHKLVSGWMDLLRKEGFEITCDWTVADASAPNDAELPIDAALRFARADLKGVADAGVVWHIVADYEGSRGAYFEIGYAHAMKKTIYVSGPTWRKSIFHHLAARKFDTHQEAFDAIVGWKRSSR
jgi:nucleoside 2-deoxyribosyltransferase